MNLINDEKNKKIFLRIRIRSSHYLSFNSFQFNYKINFLDLLGVNRNIRIKVIV
jgi:hypothetical protein